MIIVDAKLSTLHLVFQFQLLTLMSCSILFLESKQFRKIFLIAKNEEEVDGSKSYMRYSVDFFACVYSLR